MGNKQRMRKKSSRAIKITNKKNALQRYVKKSMEQLHITEMDTARINILLAVSTEKGYTEEPENPIPVENDVNEYEFQPVSGRRIVDINYILQDLQEKARHNGLFNCTLGNFRLIGEKRRGLLSVFRFQCNMCKEVCLINSEDQHDKEQVNLNIAATTGIVASGIGFSQFEELLSAMDVPVFSSKYYSKLEDKVFQKWTETSSASMEAAAQMEKDIAIAEGRTKNGIPMIDVYVDGSWCAR